MRKVAYGDSIALPGRDFVSLQRLKGVYRCRCAGSPRPPSKEIGEAMFLSAPIVFLDAISQTCTEATPANPFRYLLCSGIAVERDQSRSLWFLSEYRKMRVSALTAFATLHSPPHCYADTPHLQGRGEDLVMAYPSTTSISIITSIARPAAVSSGPLLHTIGSMTMGAI